MALRRYERAYGVAKRNNERERDAFADQDMLELVETHEFELFQEEYQKSREA